MEDKISNEKINKSQNGYKKISGYKEKTKSSFGKSVLVPFITSIIGATLVVGVCFGVPEIKNKILNYPVR